ncbi:MAG: glycoside hydrolase family 36 protein [Candidatus Spyradocola sp.]|jgi:alpha-galactosidase
MDYRFGDMVARYTEDAEGRVGLLLFPADCPVEKIAQKQAALDPLVQIQFAGDRTSGGYAAGSTMRCGESTLRLRKVGQTCAHEGEETRVETQLEDDRGNRVVHVLTWQEGDRFLRAHCTYTNAGQTPRTLLLFSSFSLEQISPYLPGDGAGKIRVHRLQSRWSQEGRLLTQTLEELQLEPSWALGAVRCERFGQVGSMPVNHYFPFLAVEDTATHVFWGAQIAHPASWQMEIYRRDENLAVSGGLADREFGHWKKTVQPGESFRTPEAILTVAHTERLDDLCQRLVEAGERAANAGPACEQDLPIVFNEYCTTWGVPSHENIQKILEAIRGRGVSYFVIDCGWYKQDGVHWAVSMGDYIPSKTLFPEGLEKTVEAIHRENYKAGIWFEIENVGPAAQAFQYTDHLLHLDGAVLSTPGRRFWNMTDPWVLDYLRERVIGTLKKYGFDYMKIDYNDTIGIGCDGAESPGEGLRRNMAGTMAFLEEVKREIPGIILENCASGGHRLEPGFLAATSMASFSDAHECPEIPIIAANLHRAMLPRQSQIWAVIRKTDSCKRIAYSLANTFLGRMCLSGDVTELSPEQWAVIDAGIAFYKRIAPVIREGQTYHLSPEIPQIRHPEGWQGIVRLGRNGEALALLHTFGGELPQEIRLPLPEGTPTAIAGLFSDTAERVEIRDGALVWRPAENWKAVAVLLTPER